MYKVYKHTVPNGKIYIGITSLTVENRWRNGKGYKNSIFFNRAIQKYGWENIKHEILFDNFTLEEAENAEIKTIEQTKSNNKKYGYNIENGGGKGAVGIKRSTETLAKMSKANLGKTMSNKIREKISKSLMGRVFTEEHKKKMALAETGEKNHRFGTKASIETRKKMASSQPKGVNSKFSRRVIQISAQTCEVIKIWDSMGDVRRELGIKHCTISDCCRGKQKTSGGFIWKYFED